jgi:hypothetical protein
VYFARRNSQLFPDKPGIRQTGVQLFGSETHAGFPGELDAKSRFEADAFADGWEIAGYFSAVSATRAAGAAFAKSVADRIGFEHQLRFQKLSLGNVAVIPATKGPETELPIIADSARFREFHAGYEPIGRVRIPFAVFLRKQR